MRLLKSITFKCLNYSFNNIQTRFIHKSTNSLVRQLPNLNQNSTISKQNITFSSLPRHKQTICALASGSGACGVAVIRVSGPNSLVLSSMMLSCKQFTQLKPRYAMFSKIFHPVNKGLVDTGLVLWFPGPNSFTGEDVLELQVHGSPAIVKCLLSGIVQTDLARIADAGEFTRRAYFNNKMDLSEVEGLRDLLNAETDVQRKQALTISQGVQSRQISEWISRLMACTTLIDGHIEFGDTDDVTINLKEINSKLLLISNEITHAIKTSKQGFTIKSGINIALYGETNVGKSSLLNLLASEDRAIVSDMPNTTRDLIQVRMDINGYPVNLIDTAGFYNDPAHRVETEAMKKSLQVLFLPSTALHILVISSDVYLKLAKSISLVKSSTVPESWVVLKKYLEDMFVFGLIQKEQNVIESLKDLFVKNTIVVITKLDLIESKDLKYFDELLKEHNVIGTSIINNIGVTTLFDCINLQINHIYMEFSPDDVQFSTLRTLESVKIALTCLNDATLVDDSLLDTKSYFIRSSINHLSKIFGKSCSTDMLDDIFEDFCVGK